jgi:glutamate synthase domain-containing protein 2
LSTAEVQRKTIDVERLADALTMRAPGSGGLRVGAPVAIDAALGGDLVAAGVAIVAALLR